MSSFPQYYRLLNLDKSATSDQVRQAYKRESLKTHPDRLPKGATSAERKAATERFQAVADAYYVLSDPARRREYDQLYASRASSSSRPQQQGGFTSSGPADGFPEEFDERFDPEEQEQASGNFFRTFANMFGAGAGAGAGGTRTSEDGRPDANHVFGDVFEDMLAPEVAHVRPFWSYLGGAAGATMGYIIGNIPGAVAGGVAGNRVGAIRDAKGKSVGEVFMGLGGNQKAQILRALAFKVLGSMGSS